jgi:hypothetical protein
LSAHFLDKQILTPHTPKKFQTYLYQRKVLMRINPNAESGSPPTEGETVWHQVHCTRCHKEPEIQANYCGSERVFSRAGDLITKKRNRLSPEFADSVICLRYWLGLPEITEDEIKRFEGSQEEVRSTSFW